MDLMSTKNSIDVALAENGRENEVRCLGTIGGGMAPWIRQLVNLSVWASHRALSMKQGPADMKFAAI